MSDLSPARDLSALSKGLAEDAPLSFRDRTTPLWASAISVLFSLGSGVCLLAVAVFLVFFYEQVALNGQRILAPLLWFGALVPIVGGLIFDLTHARAMSGFRYIRTRHQVRGKAIVGCLAAATLAFLDPLLAAPFLVGGLLSGLLCTLAARWVRREPMWEFAQPEAISFLSGRDQRAVDLANAARADSPLLDGLQRALSLAALVSGCALASWFTANEVLSIAAIATISLLTYWSVDAFTAFFRQNAQADPENLGHAQDIVPLPAPYSADAETAETALIVSHLTVRTNQGTPLLSDVSFQAEPGAVIGICGDSFSGKSLLLQALQAPQDLEGLSVEGHVSLHGTPLWSRTAQKGPLPAVLVPPTPLSVPGGGAENLACFAGKTHLDRARRTLQSLVFTADTVSHILSAKDVRHLSQTEQKALSFARALALRPQLYLFDRPEDGASESLLAALGGKLKSEARLGQITLMITENRGLLECCDQLLMMQNGRIIEFAPTKDIRARQSSGWSRFVTERDLDNEEALDAWLCSHFRREGDEGNRRAVCMVANEMLSIACQAQADPQADPETVAFEFKHHVGKCELRLIDTRLALSTGAMQKARVAADTSVEGERLSPLAKIMRDSLEVETGLTEGDGYLLVTIKTYDPRLLEKRKAGKDATPKD